MIKHNKIKYILVILSIVAVIGLLIGCTKITDGRVYEKTYIPARTELRAVPHYIWSGKFATVYYTYVPVHRDEEWRVSIEKIDNETGRRLTATYEVPEVLYNEIEIGDYI